jgi:catechol 2,3-dioxygenase-like lactoylglutathione lyase family enzyme
MIKQILHTAILVQDLTRSRQFYTELLGLPEIDRPFSYRGIWYQLNNYQLHLIEDASYQYQVHQPDRWGRNSHIALGVDSLPAIADKLKNHGCEIQASGSGRAAIFCQDPDGHIVEIAEV